MEAEQVLHQDDDAEDEQNKRQEREGSSEEVVLSHADLPMQRLMRSLY